MLSISTTSSSIAPSCRGAPTSSTAMPSGSKMTFINNPNIEPAFIPDDEGENDMIMPTVDPEEWAKECNRVKQYINNNIGSKGTSTDSKDASFK